MRNTLVIIGATLALTASLSAQAMQELEFEHEHKDVHKHVVIKKSYEGLDLTDEQKQQLKALREQHKEGREAMREAREAERKWMKEKTEQLMQQEQFDAQLAAEIAQRKAENEQKATLKYLEHKHKMQHVFTDEQREKLKDAKRRVKKRVKVIREY